MINFKGPKLPKNTEKWKGKLADKRHQCQLELVNSSLSHRACRDVFAHCSRQAQTDNPHHV